MTDIALDEKAKFAAQLRNAANEMRAEDHNGWPVLCDTVADYLETSPSPSPASPAQGVTEAAASIAAMVADWYGNLALPKAHIPASIIEKRLAQFTAAIGAGGQAVAWVRPEVLAKLQDGRAANHVDLSKIKGGNFTEPLYTHPAPIGQAVAWQRKWSFDGVDVMTMPKKDGPAGWQLHEVTRHKCLPDDVPLYYAHPCPSLPLRDEVEQVLASARVVVDACAGDNKPAIGWAREVRDEMDALLARLRAGAQEPSPLADPTSHASTSPGPVNCSIRKRFQGEVYPRTCERCRLGPCPFFHSDDGSAKGRAAAPSTEAKGGRSC